MVNIGACYGHAAGGVILVDLRLIAVRVIGPVKIKILRDELVVTFVLFDNVRLPGEELCDEGALKTLKFCGKTLVDRAAYIRKIRPVVHAVAPVIQTEFTVEIQNVRVFFLQGSDEHLLNPRTGRSVALGLVVQLEADDVRNVL